jgi:hypothetical protein
LRMASLELERLIVPNAVRTLPSSISLSILQVMGVSVSVTVCRMRR